MKKLSYVLVISMLAVILPATANEAGKALYQACVACHGATAGGNVSMGAPALAGQQQAYLQRQLENFKKGIRGTAAGDTGGAQMVAMAESLPTGQAVNDVSAYLASLPAAASSGQQSGDLRNGNNYYHSKCGACHGGKAEGNSSLNSPRLSGLSADYIKRQYHNFQQGIRGAHADDRYGRQMKLMSSSLPTDKDLDDVIFYIQAQGAAE